MSEFIIKKLETDTEINDMGYVHFKSWHQTYTGLIDSGYLNSFTLEKAKMIALSRKNNALIAKVGEKVVGFVGFGPYRDAKNYDIGEVYSIYVLAHYQGRKIGYNLINAAIENLYNYKNIVLWVLKDNNKAISFYEKCGFRLDGVEKNVMLGTENTELRMTYDRF